ncbi:MAG: carbamoyl-phosphate synthase (glutamine-hydrolyzing) large subunit [Phocaeicola sp.]|jgi:carbamoyl-phosphate synthase large subunit|uniref:Carbamoyl-phosphate synthase (Glutamine-hydrolyzing) large subunit n=2 Tax=Phocaeicola coprocola TaxID=310298 RepID=A0A921FFB1_9BACT|nr:carbamoyl-phosphate synthase (glutamine-hydrolyzing) large subunit [Phocaeicola coprocola]MBS4813089.1 carbamoyl-phosphate synthase (glutamine-hydrolyzing) large subunit [Bacteroides sp.]MBM6714371.1 carbamoyl-phosphate synthase (glutamine-hydrolyzing) large subunit [Phocaeicola coprocola]MBM6903745.1 carbamoyl-phosphate synthase (glutamine-hydrolyzing) large subunit [Phocaeicola coprocola]HCM11487.1 carbamoyl phosphate synthase large subunit [Bacteroides sp.]HJF09016.1 carbamoyl-phosphate 
MKKELKKVLVLGSGALKIGQAGEFDYSGSQALKALREEGISSVLVNPNIATIQTSEGIADQVYFLPVTPYFVTEIIKKERPDGILLAFGGQTALNCGTELYQTGVLKEYGVQVLGTSVEAIMYTEDRDLFVKKLDEIEMKTPVSQAVENMEDALAAARRIGYPVMIRSAYALGGLGSGICPDETKFIELAESAFTFSPQILVEESLKGWKEIEFEVIRDANDHCFTVASMENFDPLGIHTGESIVVAPTCSLTQEQVTMLQDLSKQCIRHLGIVGECNIQYAFNADTNDYRVIEVNARLSRSSALASKATGYPLAFVAAKIALGYTLDEIGEMGTPNSAYVAPSLDYLICKIPRWDLTKFVGVSRRIGSSMKSVGEIMSIGRSFEEIIQKGLRMIGQGMHGFVGNDHTRFDNLDDELANPTDLRIFAIAQALEEGYDIQRIYDLTKIDPWFIGKLKNIVDYKVKLQSYNSLEELPAEVLKEAKVLGFSDFQIARFVLKPTSGNMEKENLAVRAYRKKLGILPAVKRINTVASEHPELTNYLYMTYGADGYDVNYYKNEKSVVVLGSGAYRIGSSVEFDWCSVNAIQTARKLGYKSIMINYNPETVSTDYDMCDRLYFDELSFERVLDVIDLEQPRGVIVSVGGQIPNNLAMKLYRQSVPILGTSPISIDRAENRNKFSAMLDQLGIDQPAWQELTSLDDVKTFVAKVGYPVLVRPSYVLSGAAMNVCYDEEELTRFLQMASEVSKEYPVVVSQFMQETKEIEFDAVAQNGEVVEYAISEHIEYAGVHSGDATLVFPAQQIYFSTARQIKKISRRIAQELNISGPFNIQFLARKNEVKVIECNLRASRSFPFVSKVLKRNFIETATRIMLDAPYTRPDKSAFDIDRIGVKASQFSFARLQNADPVLGVDMSSTGEVGCLGDDFNEALLNSLIATGYKIPKQSILLSSGATKSKVDLLDASHMLSKNGYHIYATAGTATFLNSHGIPTTPVFWPDERPHAENNVMKMIAEHKFDLIVNIPKNHSKRELTNGYRIRRGAIDHNIPLMTNARLAKAFIEAFCQMKQEDIQIKSWQEYK